MHNQRQNSMLNNPIHPSSILLRKIPQLGQLVQQFLQVAIGDLMLKARNQRLGFFRVVAAQTSYVALANMILIIIINDRISMIMQ